MSDRGGKAIGKGGHTKLTTQLIVGNEKEQVILGEVHMAYDAKECSYTVLYVRRGREDYPVFLENISHNELSGIVAYQPVNNDTE